MLYDCEKEIRSLNKIDNIYSLCGVDKNGKATIILTYYSDNDTSGKKTVSLDLGKKGEYEIYKVNNDYNGELVNVTGDLTFEPELFDMLLIKEK